MRFEEKLWALISDWIVDWVCVLFAILVMIELIVIRVFQKIIALAPRGLKIEHQVFHIKAKLAQCLLN